MPEITVDFIGTDEITSIIESISTAISSLQEDISSLAGGFDDLNSSAASGDLSNLTSELQDVSGAEQQTSQDTQELERNIEEVSNSSKSSSSGLSDMQDAILALGGAIGVANFSSLIMSAGELNEQLAATSALVGNTGADFDNLKGHIASLASGTGVGSKSITMSLLNMQKTMGLSAEEAYRLSDGFTNLGVVSLRTTGDSQKGVDALSNAMLRWETGTKLQGRALGVLAKQTGLTEDQLTSLQETAISAGTGSEEFANKLNEITEANRKLTDGTAPAAEAMGEFKKAVQGAVSDISKEVLPVLTQLINTFLQLNTATGGNLIKVVVGLVGAVSGLMILGSVTSQIQKFTGALGLFSQKSGDSGGSIAKTVKNLEKININLKKDLVNILKGAAVAIVAIAAAFVVLEVALLALAGFGATFKALEPQVRAAVTGLQLIVAPLALLAVVGVVLGLLGAGGLALIPAIITGLVVAIVAIAAAFVVLEVALLALAGFGATFTALAPQVEAANTGLTLLTGALMNMVIAFGLLAVVGLELVAISIEAIVLNILTFFGADPVTSVGQVLTAAIGVANVINSNPIPPLLYDPSASLQQIQLIAGNVKAISDALAGLSWSVFWGALTTFFTGDPATAAANVLSTAQSVVNAINSHPVSAANDPSSMLNRLKNVISNIRNISADLGGVSIDGWISNIIGFFTGSPATNVANTLKKAADVVNAINNTQIGIANDVSAALADLKVKLQNMQNGINSLPKIDSSHLDAVKRSVTEAQQKLSGRMGVRGIDITSRSLPNRTILVRDEQTIDININSDSNIDLNNPSNIPDNQILSALNESKILSSNDIDNLIDRMLNRMRQRSVY